MTSPRKLADDVWKEKLESLRYLPDIRAGGVMQEILTALRSLADTRAGELRVVMTELPGPHGQFVELEDENGRGVRCKWRKRGDGFVELVIPRFSSLDPSVAVVPRERLRSLIDHAEHAPECELNATRQSGDSQCDCGLEIICSEMESALAEKGK